MPAEGKPRTPLTDSPWFWVHVFCVAGLIGLLLVGSRADNRQAQLDSNFTRRTQLHAQKVEGDVADRETERVPGNTRWVDFRVFYAVLGAGAVGSWILMWRR
jgi:hypothetical protein